MFYYFKTLLLYLGGPTVIKWYCAVTTHLSGLEFLHRCVQSNHHCLNFRGLLRIISRKTFNLTFDYFFPFCRYSITYISPYPLCTLFYILHSLLEIGPTGLTFINLGHRTFLRINYSDYWISVIKHHTRRKHKGLPLCDMRAATWTRHVRSTARS